MSLLSTTGGGLVRDHRTGGRRLEGPVRRGEGGETAAPSATHDPSPDEKQGPTNDHRTTKTRVKTAADRRLGLSIGHIARVPHTQTTAHTRHMRETRTRHTHTRHTSKHLREWERAVHGCKTTEADGPCNANTHTARHRVGGGEAWRREKGPPPLLSHCDTATEESCGRSEQDKNDATKNDDATTTTTIHRILIG